MKKGRLLLYVSNLQKEENMAIIPTLAWVSKKKGVLFDTYLDAYRKGVHNGGGDFAKAKFGNLTGSLVSGGHHIEQLSYFINKYDTKILSTGSLLDNFFQTKQFRSLTELYTHVLKGIKKPQTIAMIGSQASPYCYPEIYSRKAIGVTDSIKIPDLDKLGGKKKKILCFYVAKSVVNKLIEKGYTVKVMDSIRKGDDFASVTARIASRFKWNKYIMGDPALVTSHIAFACKNSLISVYGRPQSEVFRKIKTKIKGNIIYGRQYDDTDFFTFSKNNLCLKVIDPAPPVIKIETKEKIKIPEIKEPDDETLKKWIKEKKILSTVLFWSGAPRELENLYRLTDLVAITGLRCGLITTSDTFRYPNSALKLLGIPMEYGGVWPLIEPLLGSGGNGICIEYLMNPKILHEELVSAISYICKRTNFQLKGYWATMDAVMEQKPVKRITMKNSAPYIKIKHNIELKKLGLLGKLAKGAVKKTGASKAFVQERPYDNYAATSIKKGLLKAVADTGLKYMFTKSDFGRPKSYTKNNLTVLNYATGQWDGWTPFYTINSLKDIKNS